MVALEPLAARVGSVGRACLVGGGVAYTLGAAFFALAARLRYAHCVWHVFVALGTARHFFAVLGFAV